MNAEKGYLRLYVPKLVIPPFSHMIYALRVS